MQRSFKSRIDALEQLERTAREVPRSGRSYLLPIEAYPQVIVGAFRSGGLIAADGRIAVDTNPNRGAWPCHWIADALTEHGGWGDLFLSQDEIADARALLGRGWLTYGWSDGIVIYPRPPAEWLTKLSQAESHHLYMTDRPRYFAAHATGRAIDTAARVAAWRGGQPIVTLEALDAWLATARPFVLDMALIEAIGPIVASGLVAHGLGLDPDTLDDVTDD